MEKSVETEEKKFSKFQWFFATIFVPLVFLIFIALIVMSVAGIDIFGKTKEFAEKVPFVADLVNNEEQSVPANVVEDQQKITELETELKQTQAEIATLEKLIDTRDSTIERTEIEKQQLEKELEQLRADQQQNQRAFKDIVSTYESMSAKKAAPIISSMSDEDAVKILASINTDNLASIMEQMAPEDAARLTSLLAAQ